MYAAAKMSIVCRHLQDNRFGWLSSFARSAEFLADLYMYIKGKKVSQAIWMTDILKVLPELSEPKILVLVTSFSEVILYNVYKNCNQNYVCLFVMVLYNFQHFFSHIMTMSGCDKELDTHFYSAALLKNHAPDTTEVSCSRHLTWYHTKSHYPDTGSTRPSSIL